MEAVLMRIWGNDPITRIRRKSFVLLLIALCGYIGLALAVGK
jgi:hypothetical protein